MKANSEVLSRVLGLALAAVLLMPAAAGAAWADPDGDGRARDRQNKAMRDLGAGTKSDPVLLTAEGMALTFTDMSVAVGLTEVDPLDPFVPIGGGGAWADLNGDGRPELIVARNGQNRVMRNLGGGTLSDVTAFAGLEGVIDVTHSVTVVDFDNDGDQDIFFGNNGQNRLWQNQGSGVFEDVSAASGLDGDSRNTASVTWADYDNDGFLDVFMVNHIQEKGAGGPPHICWGDQMFHNNGDGSFTDLSQALGVDEQQAGIPGCGLATTFSDYDSDGDMDLFVINDFGRYTQPNVLYRNDGPGPNPGDWIFTNVSATSRANFEIFGMGISMADVYNNGHWDFYTTHAGPNKFAVGDGRGGFDEAAVALDISVPGFISWGCDFADFDLDGNIDLVVATGNLPGSIWPTEQSTHLFLNTGWGSFVEVAGLVGMLDTQQTRGLATADYDDDGDVDVFLGNVGGTAVLYRNDGGLGNNFLKVTLTGQIGNRDAIGSRIRIEANGVKQQREINGGSSFMSMNYREALFGLGSSSRVDSLEVTFPSGIVYTLADVDANERVAMIEPLVTIMGTVDRANTVPGSTMKFISVVKNHSDVVQTQDIWHGVISPMGGTRTIRGPINLTLDPGEEYIDEFTLVMSEGRARGPWRFLHRTGTFNGGMTHQSITKVNLD